MVSTVRPVNASPDWKVSTDPEIGPLQGERSGFRTHLCLQGEKCSSKCQPRPFYSQPIQLPCCMSWLCPPTSPYWHWISIVGQFHYIAAPANHFMLWNKLFITNLRDLDGGPALPVSTCTLANQMAKQVIHVINAKCTDNFIYIWYQKSCKLDKQCTRSTLFTVIFLE